MTLKWYGKEVNSAIDQATLSGIVAAAITLEGEAIKLITSYPAVDTGRLRASISYKATAGSDTKTDGVISTPARYEALIGTNVEYAGYVEYGTGRMRPRSFLRRAMDESKDKVQWVFSNQFMKVFK